MFTARQIVQQII
ncbi:hypothetical protein LINPERPRIM_LOCUS33299 [Linum perenne]